jgi:hypothetical protein
MLTYLNMHMGHVFVHIKMVTHTPTIDGMLAHKIFSPILFLNFD